MPAAPTYTFSANTKIKSAEVNQNFTDAFPTWSAFSPNWTTSGGGNSIGSGTSSARYAQHGKLVVANYNLTCAADTNVGGSGYFTWEFPVAQNTSQQLWSGIGQIFNSGVAHAGSAVVVPLSSTTLRAFTYSGADVGVGSPFAWGNGDYIRFTIIFEAA